jgi:hypothetical protein
MMGHSKNEKVQIFLNELQTVDGNMHDVIAEMRKIIFKIYPQVQEKMMYGGIIFSVDTDFFCGLFTYTKHASLEFSNGYLMEDASGHLEGKGKFRRHLKILKTEDIKIKDVEEFVKKAL